MLRPVLQRQLECALVTHRQLVAALEPNPNQSSYSLVSALVTADLLDSALEPNADLLVAGLGSGPYTLVHLLVCAYLVRATYPLRIQRCWLSRPWLP